MERYHIGIAYSNGESGQVTQSIVFTDEKNFNDWRESLRKLGYKKFEIHPLTKILGWISPRRAIADISLLVGNTKLSHTLRQIAEKTPPHNEHGEPAYNL